MTEIHNKLYLNWEDFENFINEVVKHLRNSRPSGVYGLPRGGLVPAVVLSHRLGIPLLMAPAKDCIVVDDIADSGITLQHYVESCYHTITWVYKPKSIVKPNKYSLLVNDDRWIVFPWEANV